MNNKPNIIQSIQMPEIRRYRQERYLPTAFNDSLTLVEKVNKVVEYLFSYTEMTEQMLVKWNEVYHWIMNEGLDSTIGDRLNEMLKDGTFKRIINEELFGELNSKIDRVESSFDGFKNQIDNDFNNLKSDLQDDFNQLETSLVSQINNLITFVNEELKNTVNIVVSKTEPTNTIKDKSFWYKEVSM